MTVTTDQQIDEGNELACSESVTTSISSRDKKDEEIEDKVISVVAEGIEGDESVLDGEIDKVNMEGEEEKKTEGEDAVPAEMEVEPSKEGETDSATDNVSCAGGDDNDISVVTSNEGVVEGSHDKEEGAQPKDIHQEQEAELEAYLESLKPKPKRKSVKEMLMAMPGYKDISFLKPKIGGDVKKDKKDVIILDDEAAPPRRMSKRQQQIEDLKDRFVKHALVAPPKPLKEEHVKLRIKKKEEDSQGIEHLVENVVDYVRNPLNEEEEARSALTPLSLSTSPQGDKPGAKYSSLRKTLLGQIRMKKLKLYEERIKTHAEENEKSDDEVEEGIFGDAANSEEDSDDEEDDDDSELGEEEEELEDLLGGPGPEKREKNIFVDDEAEDEDGDDEDDEYDGDNSDSDSEPIEKDQPASKSKTAVTESDGDSKDSDFITPAPDSQTEEQEESTSIHQSENENSTSMDFGIDPTPKVTATFLNPATPSDFWIAKSSVNNRQPDGLSPLIPRIHRNTDILEMEKEIIVNASVQDSLVNVISETKTKFDDLVDLCSGTFVTQQNSEPSGIQDDDEFGNFDFGDDDDLCEDNNKVGENSECVKTPVAGSSRNAVNGITPKLAAKPTIARRSMQFEMEAEEDKAGKSMDNTKNSTSDPMPINIDDEDDDGAVTRRSIKKNKRLQFSDDEDDDDVETTPIDQASEDEQSDKAEEEVQVEPEPPKAHNPFFNKDGKLKRKFVEDEAELSGSEEGSGDEDERGLNDYEMEEGDDEQLDESQVRDQVARTHMKLANDDDERHVRALQNILMEDGEFGASGKRDRKFFERKDDDFNDDARMGNSDGEEQEETSEELLKKNEWIEKRKWISENSHLLDTDADESQSLLSSIKIGRQTLKRIESFVDTSTSESKDFHFKEASTSNKRNSIWEKILESRKAATKTPGSGSNSLTACSEMMNFRSVGKETNMSMDESSSKSMSEPMFGGTAWTKNITSVGTKGSFLSRGGMMFAKLAETSKTGDAVSNVKNNSRNFVFSHITPPNPEKTDGSTSKVKRATNKGGCKAQAKKIKVDRSFHNLDEASKQSSVFQFL